MHVCRLIVNDHQHLAQSSNPVIQESKAREMGVLPGKKSCRSLVKALLQLHFLYLFASFLAVIVAHTMTLDHRILPRNHDYIQTFQQMAKNAFQRWTTYPLLARETFCSLSLKEAVNDTLCENGIFRDRCVVNLTSRDGKK